ncbi:MAG: glycosyltransferase [Acetobacteraceae bacterium]|nr:glycosyltransferase [Acetobacteraceae bacterium]
MGFYFDRFEDRLPPPPLPYSPTRESVWQFLATVNLVFGAWYLFWRWTASLNPDALWFAIPLVTAETLAFVGLILFTINLWRTTDPTRQPAPTSIRDCVREEAQAPDRPVSVDVFIATYNEEEELVRLSVRDAKRMRCPNGLDLRIHVLDDGKRAAMRRVAEEEGVGYITRANNVGYKAGNLRNAMEHTSGDFILICDADTRPFPTLLEHTLGYFRDPDVAFVQTPQWFYDIPAGRPLPEVLAGPFGQWGDRAGRLAEHVIGPVRVGEDPFANDPKMFYDVILRRRNWANAAFCCGAASLHRREAVMQAALRAYADSVAEAAAAGRTQALRLTREKEIDFGVQALVLWQAAQEQELTPYKFHVSEDIYTSIVLHEDRGHRWKSVIHPEVESKMLSPQDLLTWTIQRFKYAGGSLDILFHDNPLCRSGLTLPQKLMYGSTFWSYLGVIWNFAFLIAPVIYMSTGIAPVAAYTPDFFKHALPFLMVNELAFTIGTWGLSGYKGKVAYIASFPIGFRALLTVLRRERIAFHVTPKGRQSGAFLHLVTPQLVLIAATVLAFVYACVRCALGSSAYSLGGLIANGFWSLNNLLTLSVMVRAALWRPGEDDALA